MLQSCLNIMFLYLHEFWRKRFSISKILFLENTVFGLRQKFQEHKNGSNSLKYVLNFTHTYLYFKDLIKTDFCGIYVILWDLMEVKNPSF